MAEKYFSLSQLKSISRIETNQWSGPSEVCDLYDLKKLLPADVRPVVRGRWIPQDKIFEGIPFECSICGEVTTDTIMMKPRFNFCPMCGAMMEYNDA